MPCGDNPEEGILQHVSHFGRHLDDVDDDADACDDDRDDDSDNSREDILQPVSHFVRRLDDHHLQHISHSALDTGRRWYFDKHLYLRL